jgi:hypothetical protein
MLAKYFSLGKRECPENPSADWTVPSAYEKHVSRAIEVA